jgi:Zn-dependent peptidase ImmA (M78 family)
MRKSGISDPFIRRNDIERICNRFAGNFLIPESFVSELLKGSIVPTEPTIDDIARLARRFKISQQATVLRLQQINLIAEGSYDRWVTAIHNIGNPDFTEKGGGSGGPPPQEKVKLAKYGFRFARAFDDALRRGAITEIDLFRATGLKPKYQLEYFDYANSITENKLQTLELDDG